MRDLTSIVLFLTFALIIQGCMESNSRDSKSQNYALQASEVNPVLTGTPIPDVNVTSVDGEDKSLMQMVKEKPTVLIFYRGGWCPYCNKHMAQLQEAHSKLADLGYQVLAISPDKPEFLRETMQEKDLGYTLLSDSDMQASKAFGLAFKVDEETVERYKSNGMDLAERSGHDHHLLPAPAVFLINPDATITFQYVNPDYKTRIKSKVLLAAAEAYYPSES
jgi:peroxiredoxin